MVLIITEQAELQPQLVLEHLFPPSKVPPMTQQVS